MYHEYILLHGIVNLAPNAGDVIIASDQVCHGGLRWQAKEQLFHTKDIVTIDNVVLS